jgi:hypothetical protein
LPLASYTGTSRRHRPAEKVRQRSPRCLAQQFQQRLLHGRHRRPEQLPLHFVIAVRSVDLGVQFLKASRILLEECWHHGPQQDRIRLRDHGRVGHRHGLNAIRRTGAHEIIFPHLQEFERSHGNRLFDEADLQHGRVEEPSNLIRGLGRGRTAQPRAGASDHRGGGRAL